MSIKREVTVKLENDCVGGWFVYCPECPLKQHSDALGLKQRPCASGVQTNVQGAVPLQKCEFYTHDSIDNADGKITVLCGKEAA